MATLTSIKNPRIQQIRKLQSSARARRSEQLFVVEGIRLVEEALGSGRNPERVLYTEDLPARGREILTRFAAKGVEVTPLAPDVMQAASDTQTPQGILAVMPWLDLPLPVSLDFVVVIDGLRDPGNLGTILRTALAAGVQAVFLPPGCVDPYSPKVVRAAMGAHFKLALSTLEWDHIQALFEAQGLTPFLADSSGGQPHHQADLKIPLALIIGGEAAGAGREAQRLAVQRVHIPMTGAAESLNAAVAASVLMFEVSRQRTS